MQRFLCQAEFSRRLSQQNRQRVFEVRALNSESYIGRLGSIEQRLRRGNIQPAGHASLVTHIRQIQGSLLQIDIIPQDDQILIDVVRHDVI